MSDVNLDLGGVKPWASPKEFFGEGKKIKVLNFERLSKEKGETDAKYVDKEGMTYRLTFLDVDAGTTRTMEVHSRSFQIDLSNSAKRLFGGDRVPSDATVILTVQKVARETQYGEREVYQWNLELDEDVQKLNDELDIAHEDFAENVNADSGSEPL